MHSMRRGIVGRIGGFAALCAILLLTLAPIGSHMLAHARADSLFTSLCASGSNVTQDRTHAPHDALVHLDACGYCNLVTHAPAPPVIAQASTDATPSGEIHVDAVSHGFPRAAPCTHTRSRAPPAIA
jgi:hypothetical protein